MGTKKSVSERLDRMEINLGTGTTFITGEPFKPTWLDAQYVMRKIWAYQWGKYVLPKNMILVNEDGTEDLTILLGMNRGQVEYCIPMILRGLDIAFDHGTIDPEAEPAAYAIAYVLAWYWYHYLGGPRPIEFTRTRARKRAWIPEFRCPMCEKVWNPPSRLKQYPSIYRAWIVWLTGHAEEYHKWDFPYKLVRRDRKE